LKVNDENSRDPDPDPDPLVRGMDPRIRIHPKMSWIRNTAGDHLIMNPPGSRSYLDIVMANGKKYIVKKQYRESLKIIR
jgi:hypothetical protein